MLIVWLPVDKCFGTSLCQIIVAEWMDGPVLSMRYYLQTYQFSLSTFLKNIF